MKVFIKAITYHLPENVLTNEKIAGEFPEWTVEKIDKKIGIKQRRVTSEGETASDLSVGAAEKLFAEHDIDRSIVDYLIFVTQSPDYHLPTTACIIQTRLDLPQRLTAIDVNLGCNGFVAGLSLAKAVIIAGQAKNVLLLTGETYSKYLHKRDKSNLTIFGDGAAATLVTTEGIAEVGEFVIGTDGTGADNLIVKTGCARHPLPANDLKFDDFGNPHSSDNLFMDGPAILNYSLESIPQIVEDVLVKNNVIMEEIDLHVYHQANIFLAELERRKLRIPQERYYCNIENVGNTVSSTIPIALRMALDDGTLHSGMKVLSVAQGLGYTWGGMVLYF
ncbi:MAG: ketoacyl-ACP synthase III [Dysgonamonadaceae bacterium]|nr:ketoacyl-ACP synthase III [Dysgonamonadaceae bacterium]